VVMAAGQAAAQPSPEPYQPGETITYDIKKLGMKVGEATLVYRGPGRVANRDTILIEFTSRAINFLDEEKIYLDTVNMVPMVVERNLNIFGKKEKIKEFYDQQKGTVRIVKNGETQTLTKNPPIENIY